MTPRAAIALLLLAAPSLASQYNLDQARAIISKPEAKKLRQAGIRSTLDILLHGRTPAEQPGPA